MSRCRASRAIGLLALLVVGGAAFPWGLAQGAKAHASGYTVTRLEIGVQLTLQFQRRSFPERALVPVTATLRNVSHRHLAVFREQLPYGLCRWPSVSLTSVDASGKSVEPSYVITPPLPPCAFPPTMSLPRGRAVVEHQLVELWSPRLASQAQGFDRVNGGLTGFEVAGPTASLRLHSATAPSIQLGAGGGLITATLSPQPAPGSPIYFRSWGTCRDGPIRPLDVYWTPLGGSTLSSGCADPVAWHVDMAVLDGPVATLDLKR